MIEIPEHRETRFDRPRTHPLVPNCKGQGVGQDRGLSEVL